MINEVDKAVQWLMETDITEKSFEAALKMYESKHPGQSEAFRVAWVNLFGGI